MNSKLKISLLSLFWLSTLSGAFFYGYKEAVNGRASKEFAKTGPVSDSETADEQATPLSEAEQTLLENLRSRGGDSIARALSENIDELSATLEVTDEEEAPLSSAEALQAMLTSLEDNNYQRGSLWRLIRGLDTEDIPKAFEAIMPLAKESRHLRSVMTRLVKNMAQEDPAGALTLANSIESKRDRSNSIGEALSEWAKKDPYAALQWLGESPELDSNSLDRASYSVFRELAKEDLTEATSLLGGIEDDSTRQRAASGILNALISSEGNEVDSIIGFINSQPKSLQSNLLSNTLGNRKFRRFESGVTLASSLETENPQLAQQAYERVASNNARDYPEQTANWALGLEDANTQQKILGNVIEQWTRYDLAEAGQWLSETTSIPLFVQAYETYARAAAPSDPSNAITWAEAISDTITRDSAVTSVANSWAEQDLSAAKAYVQSTQYMSSEARERLLNDLNKMPGS